MEPTWIGVCYMITLSFDTSRLPEKKMEYFLDKAIYLSDIIIDLSYNSEIKQVQITTNAKDIECVEVKELKKSFNRMLESVDTVRVIKPKIIKCNEDYKAKNITQTISTNREKNGFLCEEEVLLMENLDSIFLKIAKKYNASIREYPTILNKENMDKNQYHMNFPQNIYGVTSLPHDINTISAFRDDPQDFSSTWSFEGDFLQPCICYHCYEELQEKEIKSNKVLTGKGNCFRNEAKWRKDQFRRSEFQMREIVFVGSERWVLDTRNNIMEDVWDIFEQLGLKGKISTATDPFFFNSDMETKGTYQMMSNAKYELLVSIKADYESSIASFNYCQDVLCKKYKIVNENSASTYSGCVAFGIDRWKEAILELYSDKYDLWPDILRRERDES